MSGTLFVVATPIGNLEDISARALRVLREAALIAAEDTRRTANLLARYGITTRTTSLHEHNEHSKTAFFIERLKQGDNIALVSDAGTPTVSDPGSYLIRQAIDNGIRVEPIPGPNAAIAALSVSGLPTGVFTFLGFPPTRSSDRTRWFEQLKAAGHTVVFYESPHRILSTLERLKATVGDIPVVVGRELTKAHEELVRGPISVVLEKIAASPGEFTIVAYIGHITEHDASRRAAPSELADEFGELTKCAGITRRKAIATISRRRGLSAREIYAALEKAKGLVKRPT